MQFRRFGLSTGLCLIVLLLVACANDRRQEPPAPTPTLLEIPTAVLPDPTATPMATEVVQVQPTAIPTAVLPDPTAIPTAAEVVQAQPTATPVPYTLTGFNVLPVIPYEVPVAADPAPPPAPSLTLQLAAAEGAPAPVYQRAEVARIPEETAAELLAQVPLLAGRTDAGTLTLPTARRNPPPTGGVEVHAFRPLAEAAPEFTDSNAATELEVVRFFPTGPVDWVPQINIVFSKPMVPLSSHDALAAHVPAVTLSPELAGEWQWLGTQSLLFRPAGLLAKATRYYVTLPQGTAALDGSVLAAGFAAYFETPRLQLLRTWPPAQPLHLQPHFALEFNQAIDPQELMAALRLAAGAQEVAFEVLSRDDESLPPGLQRFLTGTVPERTILLQPTELLAPDQKITLTVERGAPSAEGPLRSLEAQQVTRHTYGPLQVTSAKCGQYECRLGDDFVIHFNHNLEPESLVTGMVGISPSLPDGKVYINPWGEIRVTGATVPDTAYTLRLTPGLTDVFGQTLETVQEWEFHVQGQPPLGRLHFPPEMELMHPEDGGRYSLFTQNLEELRVLLFQIEPAAWAGYVRGNYRFMALPETPPVSLLGQELVLDRLLSIENILGETTETVLDLNPYLEGGRGHLLLALELPEDVKKQVFSFCPGRVGSRVAVTAWIQVTDMGLQGFTDGHTLLARAAELTSGDPLANVRTQLHYPDWHTQTDSEGYARFDLTAFSPESDRPTLFADQSGQDTSLLPSSWYFFSSQMRNEHRWHLFSDRYLYRPGEEVQVKGWIRQVGFSPAGDVSWLQAGLSDIRYEVYDARDVLLDRGETELDSRGALDFRFQVPADANSGLGYVRVTLTGPIVNEDFRAPATRMSFRIEEFRRPEFEVSLSVAEGPHLLQNPVPVKAQAAYYGGGGLEGASVTWNVSAQPGRYKPPGWHRYEFGAVTPWWWGGRSGSAGIQPQTLSAEMDMKGGHQAVITAQSEAQLPTTHVLQVEATVQDLSQQTMTAAQRVMVHPALWYVGGRTDSYVGRTDEPLPVQLIVTDLEGSPVEGQEIRVTTQRVSWWGTPVQAETSAPGCQLLSELEPVICLLEFPEAGQWHLDLAIQDAAGRVNTTRLVRWISGRSRWPGARQATTGVELIPDQDEYQPGDVAEILIQSPFGPAYGTVITNRAGIVSHAPIRIQEATHLLIVPIEEAHIPNLHVSVFLARGLAGTNPDEPAAAHQAEGHINLKIPPDTRELGLDLQLASRDLAPGGEATVSLRVTNSSGQPVPGAEVVLLAVDEAILALAGYEFEHPLESFYPQRPRFLRHFNLLGYLQSKEFFQPVICPGGRGGGGDYEPPLAPLFQVRTDFSPLAYFEPSGVTDAAGYFHASWDLPDTVGRYRVVAMAATGARFFGLTESAYTVRLPVQLRPQWPRFLNFDDQAEFSILVENQTGAEQDLTLIAQSDGLDLAYEAGGRAYDALAFRLPAHSRQQILVPARARDHGASQVLVTVFNAQFNDSVQTSLPVYQPAAQEGFATYGSVDEAPVLQGLELPDNVHRTFGQLSIATSSTLLQSLLDSVLVLRHNRGYDYPERLASRLLANLALRDVLYAFAVPNLPAPEVLDRDIRTDIVALQRFQNGDGGFPSWRRGAESWPFLSVHAMHALTVSQATGYHVSEESMQRGRQYLQNIEQRFPYYYSESVRRYITAYALFVRSLRGDVDTAASLRLLDQLSEQTQELEVIAWSLMVLQAGGSAPDVVAEWYRYVLNRADETTGKVVFARQARVEDGHLILHSSRRTDALLLRALMEVHPEADLIPKVVRSLMAARGRYGHWGSSQDNLFVLQAMQQYFQRYEATTPDFEALVWLDDNLVLDAPFRGRDAEYQQVSLPLDWLYAEDPTRIQIQRAGEGRLYYRLGFDYVPDDLVVEPRERGFSVVRSYVGLDDPEDVWQDTDGRWHVKLGARVRINVTLVAPGTRHHVILASPLPAGLELLNPALKGTEPFRDPNARGWYYWRWFDHQQLLDERAQVVTSYLWGGTYEYAVIARATTAGTFHVPPARATEIYAPETFGNGASEILVVEPN